MPLLKVTPSHLAGEYQLSHSSLLSPEGSNSSDSGAMKASYSIELENSRTSLSQHSLASTADAADLEEEWLAFAASTRECPSLQSMQLGW